VWTLYSLHNLNHEPLADAKIRIAAIARPDVMLSGSQRGSVVVRDAAAKLYLCQDGLSIFERYRTRWSSAILSRHCCREFHSLPGLRRVRRGGESRGGRRPGYGLPQRRRIAGQKVRVPGIGRDDRNHAWRSEGIVQRRLSITYRPLAQSRRSRFEGDRPGRRTTDLVRDGGCEKYRLIYCRRIRGRS